MREFYALTISPPSRRFSDVFQCRDDFYAMRYLARLLDYYFIVPELTFSMRLHYHGVIACTRHILIKKVKPWLRRKFGFITVKLLKTPLEHLRYSVYCRKDWSNNRLIFDNILTPYTVGRWKRRRPRAKGGKELVFRALQ